MTFDYHGDEFEPRHHVGLNSVIISCHGYNPLQQFSRDPLLCEDHQQERVRLSWISSLRLTGDVSKLWSLAPTQDRDDAGSASVVLVSSVSASRHRKEEDPAVAGSSSTSGEDS